MKNIMKYTLSSDQIKSYIPKKQISIHRVKRIPRFQVGTYCVNLLGRFGCCSNEEGGGSQVC